jgi:hypothetical protein
MSSQHTLHTLRQARQLSRMVLAWFVLSLGLAVAAPLVQPQAFTLVCSAAGSAKLVATGDLGTVPAAHPTLDCVLCLALSAPPPQHAVVAVATPVLVATAQGRAPPHTVWRTAAALPARGPPAFA